MEIFIARSTPVEPADSWILRQLKSYRGLGIKPELDPGVADSDRSGALLARADAVVAEFGEPDGELVRKVRYARVLGKSVLAFMPVQSDPAEYLPDFPGHEYRESEHRYAYNYYLDELPSGTALAIYRGTMPSLKLKIWTQALLRRQRFQYLSDEKRSELVEDMLGVDPEVGS